MPMPNATVATITSACSSRKASWFRLRSPSLEAGVIGDGANARFRQPRGEGIDFAAGRAVDDAGLTPMTGEDVGELSLQIGARDSTR